MLVPTSVNGLGLGLTELALVLEQAGRGLVCEPIALAAVSAAALAQGHAAHPIMERVMAGAALVVPALQESANGDDPVAPRTRAAGKGAALRVSGRKMFVCAVSAMPTVEGRRLATLDLADAPADLIPARQSSRNAVDALHSLALIALSAELLGVMEKAHEITLDYLRIRQQFGKPIGSFQALAHQAADMHIRLAVTRSLLFQVAANNDVYRIDPVMAVALKAKASEDAMHVTQGCIQLHGAIGFTDEHDIGLYLKRAMLLSSLLGNAAAQRRRYAAIAGLTA